MMVQQAGTEAKGRYSNRETGSLGEKEVGDQMRNKGGLPGTPVRFQLCSNNSSRIQKKMEMVYSEDSNNT